MRLKTVKKLSLISAIVIVIALALSLAMVAVMRAPNNEAHAAAGDVYFSEYKGNNGTLEGVPDGHYTAEQVAQKYNVGQSFLLAIDNGATLYNFLNGAYETCPVGYLTADVGISYNTVKDGHYKIDQNSSNAIFDRVLEGNGYTVSIYGGAGYANSTEEIRDDQDYRKTRRNNLDKYGNANAEIWYEYTGFLVAQNYGTIANLTIEYSSPHTTITADKGVTNGTGPLGLSTSNRIMSSREGTFVAGIVAGLNGYNGKIDNIRLNVHNAFTAIKKASNNTGYYNENSSYSGGIAGRAEENSKINNCWIDIINGGIFAGTEGKPAAWGSLDDHFAMAIAGGFVGNIDSGNAEVTYCALTGVGQVKAFANRASAEDRFKAYAGGIIGGCVQMVGNDKWECKSVADCNSGVSVNAGQIRGAISSWQGSTYDNFNNSPQTVAGMLFGAVGTDDVVTSISLLYNLDAYALRFPTYVRPQAEDGKYTLDKSGNVKDWSEINATTDGGKITVKFDVDNVLYDIRVHIVADGHDEFVASGAMDKVVLGGKERVYQYKMNNGEGGGFIWSGNIVTTNDSSNHINLLLDDPIYAEIYLIKSTNTGKYTYEFGQMGALSYVDTNGVDGKLVKPYTGSGAPLKLPTVVMTSNSAFDTSVFANESLWQISRDSASGISLSQTYMPGIYKMKLETKLGERVYGYYNAENRILAWQPKQDYLFTILQGNLSFGAGTTSTDGWQTEVTFELKMSGANDFDTIEFQRNGAFPSDSAEGFDYRDGSAFYTVSAGTGKNGTAYTFYAYKRDAVSGNNVVVAVSESRTVRIDLDGPEATEVEYYMVVDGEEQLLSEEDMENIQKNWTKNQIIAKFFVTDNDKSGIDIAARGNYITETVLNSKGDRNVVVQVNDSLPKDLVYVDAKGNSTTVRVQANVDRVQGRLSIGGDSYRPEGRFNYSTKNVIVRYNATFGTSGWKLCYSYQRDAQGNDIWVECPDLMTESGAIKQFTIDWNMGNVNAGIGDDFKMKMVNVAGLYEDEVFPLDSQGNRLPNDAIGNYIIWLKIADIYLDSSLDNVFVEGEDRSVADILASGEGDTYFAKEYDGTDIYKGKKEYSFYADLSKLNVNGFYGSAEEKLGVIYTPAGMSRPRIDLGNGGRVTVELRYSQSNSGAVKLYFSVPLYDTDQFNYQIHFTDLSQINFQETVYLEEDTYWSTGEIDTKINKRRIEIQLAEHETLNENVSTYYYGDDIPKSVEFFVEAIGEIIEIQLKTNASSTAGIGIYAVAGIAPNGYANIEYVVNPTDITIQQRPVAVDLRFDDGEIGNIPTGVNAGVTHTITGTYQDVNDDTQSAEIKYILNGEEVQTIGAVGEYICQISLTNNNYVISGQTSFRFKVAKAFLDVTTGLRKKDYTSSAVDYNLIIPEQSRDLYEDSDLQVTYYKYLDGSTFNEVTNEITGTWDRVNPLEGAPTERGLYHVEVEFITANHPNFFKNKYSGGDLVIVKAGTQVNVEKTVLEYSFTAEKFTFDLQDAVAEVRSSSNKQLWAAGNNASGIIKVMYQDPANKTYIDVAPTPKDGGGWYSEVGTYNYRIKYMGDDNYESSETDVVLVINKAELKGITFKSVEGVVYDGKSHLPTVTGLLNYTGLDITYQYGTKIVNDLNELSIVNASDTPYNIIMKIKKDGYQDLVLTATVKINKAKISDVSADPLDVEYDGRKHTVNFKGLELKDGAYYYKGTLVRMEGNTEGNAFATNVLIDPELGEPSYYSGKVTLNVANYEPLELNTYINIRQTKLPYKEIGKDLPKKLPSGMDLRAYRGYFIDTAGKQVNCSLIFRDAEGNIVELNEQGTLADGRYRVEIVIPNDNFYLDEYWDFEIGEINSKEISAYGFVAIGVVAALMAAAAITAIVVVRKRKKAGIV